MFRYRHMSYVLYICISLYGGGAGGNQDLGKQPQSWSRRHVAVAPTKTKQSPNHGFNFFNTRRSRYPKSAQRWRRTRSETNKVRDQRRTRSETNQQGQRPETNNVRDQRASSEPAWRPFFVRSMFFGVVWGLRRN